MGVFSPSRENPAANPLSGLTPREIEAVAARLEQSPPLPYRLVGQRLGVNRQRATYLTKRGIAKIEANGYRYEPSPRQAA